MHVRLVNIRNAHIESAITALVKTKPKFVVLEDLNVSGLMKNRHLSKAIQSAKWYHFRVKLIQKCHHLGIEVRLADRFYASSKRCHHCHTKHQGLKLKHRTWQCLNPQCLAVNDRDRNASLNLRDCPDYQVIHPVKQKKAKQSRYKQKDKTVLD